MIKIALNQSSAVLDRLIFVCGLIILLILQSCAIPPAPPPKSITDAEYFLQQGTGAFYNDDYPLAASSFNRALKIYRSIDNQKGIIESYLNLIQTSLAIGNLSLAQQQLKNINAMLSDKTESSIKISVSLLQVKLFFIDEQYEQALQVLSPLLPEFNSQQLLQKPDRQSLNILSSMTHLAVIMRRPDAPLWIQRLQLNINHDDKNTSRYTALYMRSLALHKQQQGQFSDSATLLTEALAIYREQAYRRGIAATLQQLGNLAIKQVDWNQADQLLQRALQIHLWTLNQRETRKVLKLLITVNTKLNHQQLVSSFRKQLHSLQ